MADRAAAFDRCRAAGASRVFAEKTRPHIEKLSRPPHPPVAAADADGRYARDLRIFSRGIYVGGGRWAHTIVGRVDPQIFLPSYARTRFQDPHEWMFFRRGLTVVSGFPVLVALECLTCIPTLHSTEIDFEKKPVAPAPSQQ